MDHTHDNLRVAPVPLQEDEYGRESIAQSNASPLTREDLQLLEQKDHDIRPSSAPIWGSDYFMQAFVADLSATKSSLRPFYEFQNQMIQMYVDVHQSMANDSTEEHSTPEELGNMAKRALYVTAFTNCLLMATKLTIVILSSSLVLIASLIDSVLDIIASLVLYFAAKSSLAKNKYKYPVGRSRLEPVGVVVFSVVMSMTSLFVILESLQALIKGFADASARVVDVSTSSLIVLACVIAVKLALYIYCKLVFKKIKDASGGHLENPVVQAMYEDHLNDVVSNTFALIVVFIASDIPSCWMLDSIGAMVISLVILKGWAEKGSEHIKLLVGRSASNEWIGKTAYLALQHDERILAVDTIYAYYSGMNLIVELHIVLPEDMSMKEAHDIGDSLERRVEKLPGVERAFVHMDYEFEHKPEH